MSKKNPQTKDLKHPTQPIGFDEEGTIRFKHNAIVRYMYDAGRAAGIFDLNKFSIMPFSDEDHTQLAQLIGYSVSGFGELSYVPKETVDKCDKKMFKLIKNSK